MLDQGQAARLLMQHRTNLYAYIFACVRNHPDAEDILQNVSVAVMESLGQVNDESGFVPWAREVARRRILALQRSQRRWQPVDPEVVARLAEVAALNECAPESSHLRAALMACLEKLPADNQRLIAMRYDGSVKDIAELANQFGRSVQAVYAQIKRIKAILRDCVSHRLELEM